MLHEDVKLTNRLKPRAFLTMLTFRRSGSAFAKGNHLNQGCEWEGVLCGFQGARQRRLFLSPRGMLVLWGIAFRVAET